MIIITFLVPFFIYLILRGELRNLKAIVSFTIFFMLGVSLYLYLPIRGGLYPLLNWGSPVTFERFLWHITGKQYRVWMFTGNMVVIKANIIRFLKILSLQYTPVFIPFALLGLYYLFSLSKKDIVFMLILFCFNFIYGINYEIPDIEPYFIISLLSYTIFICYGLLFLVRKIEWLIYPILVLAIFVLVYNFHNASERENYFAYDLCGNLFSSVKENGIVITNNWDYYSPALYLKEIEGKRRDIVIIDKELLRRSWYFDYLTKQYPWLIKNSSYEVESYLELLDDFEHSRLKSSSEIQHRYLRMLNSFIEKNKETRPCYITFVNGADKDAPFIAKDYQKIPFGIVYELAETSDTSHFDYSTFCLRGVFEENPFKNERTCNNLRVYQQMGLRRGIYLLKMGCFHSSIETFEFTAQWEKTKSLSLTYLAIANLFLERDDIALTFFKKAREIEPNEPILRQAIRMIESGERKQLEKELENLLLRDTS